MLPDLFNNIYQPPIERDTNIIGSFVPSKKIRAARERFRARNLENRWISFFLRASVDDDSVISMQISYNTDTMAVLPNIFVNASDRNVFWFFFFFRDCRYSFISFSEWFLKFDLKLFLFIACSQFINFHNYRGDKSILNK